MILSKDKFPKSLAGGLESDLTLHEPTGLTGNTKRWSVAIANKTRLKKEISEAFRLKLEELTGLKWKRDSVSSHVFHYTGETIINFKEKKMAKSMQKQVEKDEQMDLIDVGPENNQAIVDAVRIYKKHQRDRLDALKKEIDQKEKVKALVLESKLQPLKSGVIKFTCDNAIIEVTPRDVLITIKEKKPKKTKKSKKKK